MWWVGVMGENVGQEGWVWRVSVGGWVWEGECGGGMRGSKCVYVIPSHCCCYHGYHR